MPESTPAVRPVNPAVQEALGEFPSGAFNYGLYFHKWFYVVNGSTFPTDRWKRSTPWACPMADETDVAKGEQYCSPNIRLDNFEVSLALFNGQNSYPRPLPERDHRGRWKEKIKPQTVTGVWDRQQAAAFLTRKHQALDVAVSALVGLGYDYFPLQAQLETPLILGLGDEHPTEKGFRFDWTLGIPFIPASSLKGVVRLAWLVNFLNRLPSPEEAEAFCTRLTDDKREEAERLPKAALALFGCGGNEARRGRVIFLDAYPEALPRLKAEIMTCHYRDYYEGKRGPTEDQQPNPQKFWAVDPYVDEAQKQPLTFLFRLLLAPEIAREAATKESLLQAFWAALKEHGLGAKTAIGHGRFQEVQTLAASGPPEPKKESVASERPPAAEVWEKARLSWEPGPAILTAAAPHGKAFLRGKEMVREILPPGLFKKVVDKRKPAEARVTVADFKILKVEKL